MLMYVNLVNWFLKKICVDDKRDHLYFHLDFFYYKIFFLFVNEYILLSRKAKDIKGVIRRYHLKNGIQCNGQEKKEQNDN
jgi:hypothetical protein